MKVCSGCAYTSKSTCQLQRKENVINLLDSDDILDKKNKCQVFYIYIEANYKRLRIFVVQFNSMDDFVTNIGKCTMQRKDIALFLAIYFHCMIRKKHSMFRAYF